VQAAAERPMDPTVQEPVVVNADDHGRPQAAPERSSGLRLLRRGVVFAGLLGFALLLLWLATDDRTLEVIPGEIVRSGRLDGGELRQAIERHGLRTVVSLTGSGPDNDWVGAERELCVSLGVHHVSLPFRVDEWPGRPDVEHLIRLLDEAERPLLFHCLRGVDRSGWASAVALLLADAPVERALRQMSPRNGHLCDPGSCPLHRFFESYLDHLSATGRPEAAASFRQWVVSSYCPEPYNAALELLTELPPSTAPGSTLRLTVRVTNRGADNWRMTDNRTEGVRLGARVIGPVTEPAADPIELFRTPNGPAVDIARSGLEAGVMPPGSRRDFELRLRAPRTEGHYLLQIDMVDERVYWFSDLGWPGLIRQLDVVASQ
jgi:protein tyrosine phosphatase (PTP) superfamily phosphohydrolase (DUF442 family)